MRDHKSSRESGYWHADGVKAKSESNMALVPRTVKALLKALLRTGQNQSQNIPIRGRGGFLRMILNKKIAEK